MTRRAALATLAGAALSACSSSTVTSPTTVDAGTTTGPEDAGKEGAVCPSAMNSAGPLTGIASGTWQMMGAYIIARDAKGLFAFSTTCTHRGCTIGAPDTTGATICPCHGAHYDGNGAVTAGPAPSPLPHFEVSVCDGAVYVDPDKEVPADTRTAAS